MRFFVKIMKFCVKKILHWQISWLKNFLKWFLKHFLCVRFYNIKKSNSCVIFISNLFLLLSFNRSFHFFLFNTVFVSFLSFCWHRVTTNSRPSSFDKSMNSMNSTTKCWSDMQSKFKKQIKYSWTLYKK